jgi:hypothetical protein
MDSEEELHYPFEPDDSMGFASPSPIEFSPTTPPEVVCCEHNNKAGVGILIGLLALASLFFLALILQPLNRCIRRRIPVSDKRIEGRYETIEGWIISKVRERQNRRSYAVPKFPINRRSHASLLRLGRKCILTMRIATRFRKQ